MEWHLIERDFFSGLPSEKEEFVTLGLHRNYRKNEFIFFEGDPGDKTYYLEKGEVKILRLNQWGKESIVFIRKSGEVFGLAEAISGKERKCSAQAITDCHLYEMQKADFEDFLSRHYPVARRVMDVLSRRLRYLGEQVENLMVCDVTTRLLKLLVYLCHFKFMDCSKLDKPITVPVRLTQQQIAAMIGSCQQTVCETLKDLEREGLVQLSRKDIIIPNPVGVINRIEL